MLWNVVVYFIWASWYTYVNIYIFFIQSREKQSVMIFKSLIFISSDIILLLCSVIQ